MITGNKLENVGGHGISVDPGTGTATGNAVIGNSVIAANQSDVSCSGIMLEDNDYAVVFNNRVADDTGTYTYAMFAGIEIKSGCTGIKVTGNDVSQCSTGISDSGTSTVTAYAGTGSNH